MTQEHPITPPPELVLQWLEGGPEDGEFGISKHVATQAARWGADQELEACCEYLTRCAAWEPWEPEDIQEMRDLRRPKPPSLKEQALQALEAADFADYPVIGTILTTDQHALIRTALEMLPD
jgi:hypothetical protein